MEVTIKRQGASAVVTVTGDVDSETSPRLHAEITGALLDGGNDMNVDMAGVTFLNSAGLTVLIDAQRNAERFSVQPGNRVVDRLIALTGLSILYGSDQPTSAT